MKLWTDNVRYYTDHRLRAGEGFIEDGRQWKARGRVEQQKKKRIPRRQRPRSPETENWTPALIGCCFVLFSSVLSFRSFAFSTVRYTTAVIIVDIGVVRDKNRKADG